MLVCVNFGDEILLRGENVKHMKNLIMRNDKTVILRYSTSEKFGNFLDLE